jgi:hypothetical protein
MKIAEFYMVMRLSRSSDTEQAVDSLPRKKYPMLAAAMKDANVLTIRNPNARAFVVLKVVGGYAPIPLPEVTQVEVVPAGGAL